MEQLGLLASLLPFGRSGLTLDFGSASRVMSSVCPGIVSVASRPCLWRCLKADPFYSRELA